MNAYKCIYNEVNRKLGTKTYGMIVERTYKFKSFNDAVNFSRLIVNTNANMIGKPIIEIVETTDA